MRINELSRRVLVPIAIDAGKWLLKSSTRTNEDRVRFHYGQFALDCDSSRHLPQILKALPNFGRNLADIANALEVAQPRVIDVGAAVPSVAGM